MGDVVLGDEALDDGPTAFRQALGVGKDELDGLAQHAAGLVDVLDGQVHGELHGDAAHYATGR
jgi:hypothetical protein